MLGTPEIRSSTRRNAAFAWVRIVFSSMVVSCRSRIRILPSTMVVFTAEPLAANTRWE
jgi:hypothetical protein